MLFASIKASLQDQLSLSDWPTPSFFIAPFVEMGKKMKKRAKKKKQQQQQQLAHKWQLTVKCAAISRSLNFSLINQRPVNSMMIYYLISTLSDASSAAASFSCARTGIEFGRWRRCFHSRFSKPPFTSTFCRFVWPSDDFQKSISNFDPGDWAHFNPYWFAMVPPPPPRLPPLLWRLYD